MFFKPMAIIRLNDQRNKYRNQKTISDGIVFDSKKEAIRYAELKLLEKAKEISDLELQPRFTLLPSYKRDGKTIRKIEYVADFRYREPDGTVVIEDVKSAITKKNPVYMLKKKLLLHKFKDIVLLET